MGQEHQVAKPIKIKVVIYHDDAKHESTAGGPAAWESAVKFIQDTKAHVEGKP